jgi:electron transport complex protein RnfG
VRRIIRDTTTTALALMVFAVLGSGLLSGTFTLTRATIAETERQAKLALLTQTLPAGSFDNDPVTDSLSLDPDPRLGLKRPGQAYLARKAGQPVAVVLEAVAPDGYAGEIRLLVGILADGRLSGVRVTSHKETPGLGDYIEIAKNAWIRIFEGRSLADPAPAAWAVRKDGGAFDYMAGATITPRAVVKAVHRALEYFEAHRSILLLPSPPGGGVGAEGTTVDPTRSPSPQPSPEGRGIKPEARP